MESVEVVRWVNTMLGLIGFFWLAIRSAIRWTEYPDPIRMYLIALGAYAFGITEGSAEAALQDAPAGARSVIYILGNIALLSALAFTQRKTDVSVANREGKPRL